MVNKDQEPFDLSDEKVIEAFQKSMESWMDKMSKDKGGYAYGYVDFEGIQANPYGQAY